MIYLDRQTSTELYTFTAINKTRSQSKNMDGIYLFIVPVSPSGATTSEKSCTHWLYILSVVSEVKKGNIEINNTIKDLSYVGGISSRLPDSFCLFWGRGI